MTTCLGPFVKEQMQSHILRASLNNCPSGEKGKLFSINGVPPPLNSVNKRFDETGSDP